MELLLLNVWGESFSYAEIACYIAHYGYLGLAAFESMRSCLPVGVAVCDDQLNKNALFSR
jgi:hypothetical protein